MYHIHDTEYTTEYTTESINEEEYEIVTKVPEKRSWLSRGWKGTTVVLEKLFYVMIFFHFYFMIFVGDYNQVSGSSMDATLGHGEFIMTARSLDELDHGDIVVAEPEAMDSRRIVKRVVAMEGDTIGFEGSHVYLNGELLEESYILEEAAETLSGEFTVPEDHVWLMGDNRNNSTDSRVIGFVSLEEVKGIAFFRYFPFNRISTFG